MDFDVIVVGGGLAGLSLAVALRQSRLSVAVVEGRTPPGQRVGWDARIYAISPANQAFLQDIGVWQHLDPGRMRRVEAMEVFGDADGKLEFSAYDAGAGELAWIAESQAIQFELWESARRQANVKLLCPAQPAQLSFTPGRAALVLADGQELSASLIVAADGADSWTRAAAGIDAEFKDYGQLGVVANFACSAPHRGTAFQWFRPDGVLAYLPLPGNLISIVWSTREAHARELLALPQAELCKRVAEAGRGRLGDLQLVTPAAGFPLRLMRAPRAAAPRLALIGDAAHTIHPLSGHGINLGFQDARVLAALLERKADFVEAGDWGLLRRYERARKEEVLTLQTATDALQRLFAPESRPLSRLRNFGLNLTNRLPLVKDLLVRYALTS